MKTQAVKTALPVFIALERAVLYARVSGDDRSKEGRNLAGQLEMGRDYAAKKNYRIVAEFVSVIRIGPPNPVAVGNYVPTNPDHILKKL